MAVWISDLAYLCALGYMVLYFGWFHFYTCRKGLPRNGNYVHITVDEFAPLILRDGTATIKAESGVGRRGVYLYGPGKSTRGIYLNHSKRKPRRPHWTVITIQAHDLVEAAGQRRVRRRRWDDAYVVRGVKPITVPATYISGVSLKPSKPSRN